MQTGTKMERQTTMLQKLLRHILLAGVMAAPLAHAEIPSQDFVGKNEWLYSSVEFSEAASEAATNISIDLIRRFNRELERNGIGMVCVMIPLKARIHSEHLPDNVKLGPYLAGNYDRMLKALRAGQVKVIDLNTPFLASPQRTGEKPLFYRHDTHWSPAGSMLAAESVRAGIDADPALKNALASIPGEKFGMVWGTARIMGARGLIDTLPEATAFAAEQVLPFFVNKQQTDGSSLLGDSADIPVTLMGSSYSDARYGFADALRYTLQRDVLPISVSAPQGFWSGMESYLRDDSFQTKRPKLLIWEIPERSMDAPPDYKYRDARYQSDNTEWLLRVSAWTQNTCEPSAVKLKIIADGLLATPADNVTAGKTTSQDFIELSFDKPVEKLDYLVASVSTTGSRKMVLEASGAGEETRWIDVPVAGDGVEHLLKVPLPSHGKGFTKLRIFPGRSSAFTFNGLKVCRQPADLLQ
jgi:alginate O-acetyltransferase complex protein AlgJ